MASNEIIVATLMLDFTNDGDGSDENNGHLSLEQLEGKDYVLWQGGVELLDHQIIGGTIKGPEIYTEDVEEYVVFSNSETSSLPKPANGSIAWSQVGSAFKVSESGVVTPYTAGSPSLDQDNVTVRMPESVIALFQAKYTAEGQKFTAITALPVVVVFAVGRVK